MLPKLIYIQRFEIHENLVDAFTDFIMKLKEAHRNKEIENKWTVYENSFGSIEATREFIFMREMDSWIKMDDFANEDSLGKLLIDTFGQQQGLQILQVGKRAIKKITTEVISRVDYMSI